jgi:hypothetical protein
VVNTAPLTIIERLRGDVNDRPPADAASAARLRATLADGVARVVGDHHTSGVLVVRASHLRRAGTGAETAAGTASVLGRERGALVSVLVRLLSVGVVADPWRDALAAWRASSPDDPLLDALAHLDDDERARLRADVRAHAATLSDALAGIDPRWLPRSGVRARVSVASSRVELYDTIDLMIGVNGTRASICLLDVTTAALGADDVRVARYHALVQTLRTSHAPRRSAIFSSATGELRVLDVDNDLLHQAARDVLALLRHRAAA